MSLTRVFQWSVIALVLVALVGLNYDFDSKAGMRMNAPLEDPLSQSLLGYWKLDEGTGTSTTADASGNSNTLSQVGPPTWTTGAIGPYAMDFSGSGQYLTVAAPSSILDFPTGASFSLTGWFNRDLFVNDHTILSNVAAQGDDGYIVWIDGDDSLYFRADDNADANYRQLVSAAKFTATGWHHFAVSWEDDRDADLYIDGALDASTKTGTFASVDDLTNANAFRLGAETDAGNPFDGKLDDIRVYGYPLSAGDVSKLYQTTAPAQPVDTGLVGHWTFDGADIQGTTVIDRSGKGNNGTATGTTKTIGKLGQGLSFNGTSDYVDALPITFDASLGNTWSVWIKPSNFTEFRTISMQCHTIVGACNATAGFDGIYWYAHTTTDADYGPVTAGVSFSIITDDGTRYLVAHSTSSCLTTNTWYHIIVTYDGSLSLANRLTIYVNGSNVTDRADISSSGTISSTFSLVDTMRIGGRFGTYPYFSGQMDDYRVYSRTFSAAEVANLYNMGK